MAGGAGPGRAVGRVEEQAAEQVEEQARDRSPAAIRDELRDVEEELASLYAQSRSLRGPLGARDDGPMDLADNAAALTAAEEQEALIEVLEDRRETLLRRLESSG